jgi:hypothetical protein
MLHCSKNIKLIITLLIIAGTLLTGTGLYYLKKVHESAGWVKVKGRILDSDINEMPSTPTNKAFIFYPDIKYEYKYDHKTYFSQQIGCRTKWTPELNNGYYAGSEDKVTDLLKKYKFNTLVNVYVNPENPTQSALIPGVRTHDFLYLIAGMLCITTALYLKIFKRAFFFDQC